MRARARRSSRTTALLIGEIYLPIERLVAYYGRDLEGAHLPFNFQLIGADWHAGKLRQLIDGVRGRAARRRLAELGAGQPRPAAHRHPGGPAQARVAAMLLLTLRGTPTLYYGDELGMENVPIPPEREQDPFGKNMPGVGQGRDPERTPMRWDTSENAGFTHGRALAAARRRLAGRQRRRRAPGPRTRC